MTEGTFGRAQARLPCGFKDQKRPFGLEFFLLNHYGLKPVQRTYRGPKNSQGSVFPTHVLSLDVFVTVADLFPGFLIILCVYWVCVAIHIFIQCMAVGRKKGTPAKNMVKGKIDPFTCGP